jgi:hypothetical protein
MFTRQDYINGNCTHEQYYNQFVNESVKNTVISAFGIERIKKAFKEDESLNNIGLHLWDNLYLSYYSLSEKMKECGDYLTMAGKVCILKAAARQIAESL